jgi:hypothetical protein
VGTSAKFDLGLDLKLFNNKVSIVTDYFTDTRKDLLIPFLFQELLEIMLQGATVNAGTVKIQGLNSVDYKNTFSDNFYECRL